MIWHNHRLVSTVSSYAITENVLISLLIGAFSVIPDAIEGNNYNSSSWKKNHRRLSHYWLPYFLIFTFCFFSTPTPLINSLTDIKVLFISRNSTNFFYLILWLLMLMSAGSLMHIIEDFFCGKVPGLTIKHRIGFRLFYVNTLKEHIYCLCYCFAIAYYYFPSFIKTIGILIKSFI